MLKFMHRKEVERMEEFVTRIEEIIVREHKKLKTELKQELKTELKEELTQELKTELAKELKTELSKELKKEILDHMFLFEENYGRKINIMYEEIMSKLKKDRNTEENVTILERRVDKNSAFVFNHENRITTLENSKI